MARAVMLAIGGILIAVLNELSGQAFQAWIPWFTTRLLRLATDRLPEDQRERFTEEWSSHSNEVAEDVGKVVFAWGCVSAAGEMAAFLNYRKGTFGPAWRGFVDSVRKWKTFFGLGEIPLEDSFRMWRFMMRTILIPALVGLLAGFLVYRSVLWKFAEYTSQSVVLVEAQKVPESMVKPVVQDDLSERIGVLKAQATSDKEMRPVIAGLFPEKSAAEVDSILEDMRNQDKLVSPFSDLSAITTDPETKKPAEAASFGIVVSYTASNARDAQRICDALTSKVIDRNLKFVQDNANGTVHVLEEALEDARNKLGDAGSKLAAFKWQHPGQLPTDQHENAKLLGEYMEAEDHAALQLNEFQQDKSFNQAALAQQLGAWKSSQSSTNQMTLQKQLSDFQAQLIDLEARYTGDHPDVVKTKAGIAEVKKKLVENRAPSDVPEASEDQASSLQPSEIWQLRGQIHKDDEEIAAASSEHKRLQSLIAQVRKQINLSPGLEEPYVRLNIEFGNAQKTYADLLASESTANLTALMSNQGQGERMNLIQPANLPDAPVFPVLSAFLEVGLGAGLSMGLGLALWSKLRRRARRAVAQTVQPAVDAESHLP